MKHRLRLDYGYRRCFSFLVCLEITRSFIDFGFAPFYMHIWREPTKDERFYNQGPLVRLYRTLRFHPPYAVYTLMALVWWLVRGAKPHVWVDYEGPRLAIRRDTRRETFKSILLVWRARRDYRMGKWSTTDEVKRELGLTGR